MISEKISSIYNSFYGWWKGTEVTELNDSMSKLSVSDDTKITQVNNEVNTESVNEDNTESVNEVEGIVISRNHKENTIKILEKTNSNCWITKDYDASITIKTPKDYSIRTIFMPCYSEKKKN
jgi:hypothetical protein